MNSAAKVGEIFTAAGQAFNRLGELTMQLHSSSTDTSSGKWTDEEIEMLHTSISRFTDDLCKISLRIKSRTVSQIRQTLKKKAYEDAGMPSKYVPITQPIQQTPTQQTQIVPQHQQTVQLQHVQQIVQVPQVVPQVQQQQQTRQQVVVQNQNIAKQVIIQPNPQQSQPQAVTLQQLQQLQNSTTETVTVADNVVVATNSTASGLMGSKSAIEMTLNRLNTQENEVDVECLPTDKLDFNEVAG